MKLSTMEGCIRQLEATGDYRVIKRFTPAACYCDDNNAATKTTFVPAGPRGLAIVVNRCTRSASRTFMSAIILQALVEMMQQFLAQLCLLVLRGCSHALLCQLDEGLL